MSSDLTQRSPTGRPTPGPWRIYGPQPDTLGGRQLTILAGTGKARFGVAHIRIINPNDALEASANAHLIAAVPDYHAAAELALAALTDPVIGTHDQDDPDWYRKVDEAVAALKAAHAKARGDQ